MSQYKKIRLLRIAALGSLIAIAFMYSALEFGRYMMRDETVANYQIWLQFAEHVAAGGTPYMNEGWIDNKPPVFQALNLIVYFTGSYFLVFFTLIGVVNSLAAYATYRLGHRLMSPAAGYIAAVFFLAGTGNLVGATINPRQFAAPLLVYAFLTKSPIRAGVSVASAGLFVQYSVLAIPGVLIYHEVFSGWISNVNWRYITRFSASGLITAALVYLPLFLLWGVEGGRAAIENTITNADDYTIRYSAEGVALWADPFTNVMRNIGVLEEYVFILVFLSVFIYAIWKLEGPFENSTTWTTALMATAIALLIPASLRPVTFYHMQMIPFVSILAAGGVHWLCQSGQKAL